MDGMLLNLLWFLMMTGAGPTETPPVDPDRSHVEQIRQRGFLWVRCFPQQISPFLSVNVERGAMPTAGDADRFTGVDINVLAAVAEDLGVELKIHPGEQATILSSFDAVEQGYGDVVAGGLTITEARKARFTFSKPYFTFVDLVLGSADPKALSRVPAGSRLAVMPGASFDENVQAAGVPPERITRYEFVGEAYESVAAGINDFTFADSTMMDPDELLGIRIAFQMKGDLGYGYVLPKGSDLKGAIDRVLTELERDGRLKKWLDAFEAYGATDLTDVPVVSWSDFAEETRPEKADDPESPP